MVERKKVDFTEDDVVLAMDILNSVEDITDFFMFLKRERGVNFTYILMNSGIDNFKGFLHREKRDTDVIIELEKNRDVNLVICQETDSEGANIFAKRIIEKLMEENGSIGSFASILTINSTDVENRSIIFALVEDYLTLLKQPKEWRGGQMTFKII